MSFHTLVCLWSQHALSLKHLRGLASSAFVLLEPRKPFGHGEPQTPLHENWLGETEPALAQPQTGRTLPAPDKQRKRLPSDVLERLP